MVRKQRVGTITISIESGRGDDMVGIGQRFTAQVDGKVTVIVGTPHGLLIGTTKGVVSRLETATGRQCAKHELDAPIVGLKVEDKLVTVETRNGTTVLLARSLAAPKRR